MAEFIPDPQQKQAIEHINGPMLVVAGAGTGKTTVLVERIVSLVANGHALPDEVLAVTYTRNAAHELRARVAKSIGAAKAEALRASTFHSFCGDVLKAAGRDFTPLSKEDLFVVLRRRIKELPLKYYIRAQNLGQFLPSLLAFFERCEDELITAEKYARYVAELKAGKHPLPRVLKSSGMDGLKPEEIIARCEEISGVFSFVAAMLDSMQLGTYGNMISRTVRLLETDATTLKAEQQHARFILIDEFQDSNVAQIRLAKLLAGSAQNVFAVGDPDQAIYRFRGATTGAFDHFVKHFSGVKHVTLDRNRRSLSPILRCAFKVIDQNPPIMQDGYAQRSPLRSAREEANSKLKAAPVELVYTPSQYSGETEACEIADTMERTIASCPGHDTRDGHKPCAWSDFAVLYRQHSHREALAAELSKRKIPIDVRGVNVLDTPEVRDALAAVRAIMNSGDSAALFRLASLPQFGISPDELRTALRGAKDATGLAPVLMNVAGGTAVLDAVAKARKIAGDKAVSVLATGLKQFAIANTPATKALTKFVEEWSQKPITNQGTVAEFIEYLDFYGEIGGKITLPEPDETQPKRNAVQFMSAHGAKGLEFPHVFIIRATSQSFPSNYREDLFEFPQALRDPLTAAQEDPKDLHGQEERRLFYVAMTRARDALAIYAKRSRSQKTPTPPRWAEATPPGFIKDFANEKELLALCTPRLLDFRADLAATAQEVTAFSTAAEWMLLPPSRSMDRMSLSASRIELYETCPMQFKISTDWNIPGEPVPAMQFGNAVHTALRGYYEALKAGRPLSRKQLLGVFEEQMHISSFDDEHQKQLYVELGLKQLGQFYDLRNSENPDVLAVEKTFEITVGGVKVVGRIDRADRLPGGGISIVDYKTGSPKDEDAANDSLQLSIYAMAVENEWNELPQVVSFYNMETNEPVASVRTSDDIIKERERIAGVAASIRAGEFGPKDGFHCRYCGYRELCPVKEEPLWIEPEGMPAKAST